MLTRLLPFVPALLILGAGGYFWYYRPGSTTRPAEAKAGTTSASGQGGASVPAQSPTPMPSAPRERARQILQRMDERLRPDLAELAAEHRRSLDVKEAELVRLSLGLNEEQQGALRQFLHDRKDKTQEAALREWITGHLDAEQLARFDVSRAAMRKQAEEAASHGAIHRLAAVVDLTPEQKDRLYEKFIAVESQRLPVTEPVSYEKVTMVGVRMIPSLKEHTASMQALVGFMFDNPDCPFSESQMRQLAAATQWSNAQYMSGAEKTYTILLPHLLGAIREERRRHGP